MSDDRPVLLVTNYAPPARVGAFAALAERVPLDLALFGGRVHHGGVGQGDREGPPARTISQAQARSLAAGGGHRAVIAGTVGRTALPAAYLGARRSGTPFVLWATLWAQPAGPAGLAGYPALRWIYSHADAVATYGPHVSDYVRARGASRVHDAPQAVDGAFWSAEVSAAEAEKHRRAPFQVVFAARMLREKGVRMLISAWRKTGLAASDAALILVGDGPDSPRAVPPGAHLEGRRRPEEVRNFYAASDVVVIPSIRTRTFREPWGMVANEAMHQGLPVIASDAVGAAAGGLVRDARNGLIFSAGDERALAEAIRRLHDDPAERAGLAAAARADVSPYTHAAWAEAITRAVADATGARAGGGC